MLIEASLIGLIFFLLYGLIRHAGARWPIDIGVIAAFAFMMVWVK